MKSSKTELNRVLDVKPKSINILLGFVNSNRTEQLDLKTNRVRANMRLVWLTFAHRLQIILTSKRPNYLLQMGLILRNFSFVAGTLFGIYIAQNYDVPDVKNLLNQALTRAKQFEERYRKPN
ncbi:hypothetical protein R6Q57_016783 [Mikania cordata]